MNLSRRAVAFSFIPVVAGYVMIGVVMLDMHKRKQVWPVSGVNAFGYQSAAMFHDQSMPMFHKVEGERRIALVGGTEAFGLGKRLDQMPFYVLQRYLNQGWRPQFRGDLTTVVSLAEVGAGAGSYVATLEDYAYLEPDAICLFDGYASVNGDAVGGGRRASPILRRLGYLPVLAGPGARQPPDVVPIATELRDDADDDVSCAGLSAAYCAAMANAVSWGLSHGKHVVVVTPPYVSRRHQFQQASLAAMLNQRFGGDSRFIYDNEGPAIDLHRPKWSTDGVHLTAAGIERMADNLVAPLLAATARP